MIDSQTLPTPLTGPLLCSQTSYDANGYLRYTGDLHAEYDRHASLSEPMQTLLGTTFPDMTIILRHDKYAGGQSYNAHIVAGAADLSDETARNAALRAIQDQMDRFNRIESHPISDFYRLRFFAFAKVDPAYWTDQASRKGLVHPVLKIMPLAKFKKTIKVGDKLTLEYTSYGHNQGVCSEVTTVRGVDFILGGKRHVGYPPSAGFSCDGVMIRIARGSERDPDAHLLYRWERAA